MGKSEGSRALTDHQGKVSLRGFAKRVGVTMEAVRKAIRVGRLEKSVVHDPDGLPQIVDVDLAEREWNDNRDRQRTKESGRTIAEERKRYIQAQTRKLRLHNRATAGQLVSLRSVEIRFATRVVTARSRFLGIPSRAKQRAPNLTSADLMVIDDLIREALEELSEGRDGHADDPR